MRILLIGLALAALPADAIAKGGGHGGYHFGSPHSSSYRATGEHYVSGYTRSNGTYVTGHYQTNPNSTRNDNYSTRGNINPHTGEPGTKPRDEDVPH
ncbi:MAG: hypothetical protein ACJ8FS_05805 [Sphingomicrobium sp.]